MSRDATTAIIRRPKPRPSRARLADAMDGQIRRRISAVLLRQAWAAR